MKHFLCIFAVCAVALPAAAQTAAEKPSVAVVCKTGGKLFARVMSGGPVIVRFAPATAAAKDAAPADGQCAFKDSVMDAKGPQRLRSKTPAIGAFLVDKVLKGGTFEVQAFDNGKGILVVTATTP